ncbi:hypothetical protein PALU110988_06450 [Paenibacillus lupini]|nr:hypothetical protein [Paenibacillus lupini]
MAFAPKIDWWLSLIIWSCIVLLFLAAISPFVIGGAGTLVTIFIVALCLPCALLILWLWVDVSYDLYFTTSSRCFHSGASAQMPAIKA